MNNKENINNVTSFKDLGLSQEICSNLKLKGYVTPSAIQALVIPELLKQESGDLIGQAQTGTGKTAAFSLPIIETIESQSYIQAIILTPTRELAVQISEELKSFAVNKKLNISLAYGGTAVQDQIKSIKRGCDILIATPGRVLDLIKRKVVKLNKIKYFVLDEADEMLNMGFIDDIESILKDANPDRRTLCFSATMPSPILAIAKKYMKQYKVLSVKSLSVSNSLTEQIYFELRVSDKFAALCRILDYVGNNFYGIIFARTKADVDDIFQNLKNRGYCCDVVHGDIKQEQRTKTLQHFKDKKISILIATDVASRGIDVANLSHVINYSIPPDPEVYVHRIGRTGRAGQKGVAITFVTAKELPYLMAIKKKANSNIEKQQLPSPEQIISAKTKCFINDIMAIVENNGYKCYLDLAQSILKNHPDPSVLLAALIKKQYNNELLVDYYRRVDEGVNSVKLFLAIGKKDNINIRELLKILSSKCKVMSSNVTDIHIMDKVSFIKVPWADVEKITTNLIIRGRKIASLAKKDRSFLVKRK